MPTISIIVPVYKVEPYLRKCVDSILAQTFKDFELILIDDGSPDNCPAICDEYAKIDDRIVVIHKENGGLSSARNAGIDDAIGDYICLVDGDDILHPQYCELLYESLVNSNAKIAICDFSRFFTYELVQNNELFVPSEKHEIISYHELFSLQLLQAKEFGACNRLYARYLFESVRFMEGKLHEDLIFAGDLLEHFAGKIAVINIPLYFYRQRSDSIVNKQSACCACSPDRVYAGEYLFEKALKNNYKYLDKCFQYAVSHPWSFVDKIFLNRNFKANKEFIKKLRLFIRNNKIHVLNNMYFPKILKKRMILFSKSCFLYGFNAYGRLLRVYLYRIFKKDAYKSGHGI